MTACFPAYAGRAESFVMHHTGSPLLEAFCVDRLDPSESKVDSILY